MPLFTTSRKPCARVRTFVHELVRLVPGSAMLGRGKQPIDGVAASAREAGHPVVAVVTEQHGNPHMIRLLDVDEAGWRWQPEAFVISGVRLSREFGLRVHPAGALQVEGNGRFAEALGIESEESDTVLREIGGMLTFVQNGKETGPRMSVRVVRVEARDRD